MQQKPHDFQEICNAYDVLPDAMLMVDARQHIVFCNTSAEVLFGYTRVMLVGSPLAQLIPQRYRDSHVKRVQEFVPSGKSMQMTKRPVVYALTAAGEDLPVSISITSVETDHGRLGVAVVRNAEAISAKIDEHKVLAETDLLTNLGNRRYFSEQLSLALAAPPVAFALFFIDLNGFKKLNDLYGHEVGDEVLRMVGKRLRLSVRSGDVVARLGGDEFVIIAKGVQDTAVLQRLLANIAEKINEPFRIGEVQGQIGASIGYALAPDDGLNEAELVRHADKVMYAAKRGS